MTATHTQLNLTVDYRAAHEAGDTRHAQEIVRSLGIKWAHSEGVSHIDCFQFYGVTNIPDVLPSYVKAYEWTP